MKHEPSVWKPEQMIQLLRGIAHTDTVWTIGSRLQHRSQKPLEKSFYTGFSNGYVLYIWYSCAFDSHPVRIWGSPSVSGTYPTRIRFNPIYELSNIDCGFQVGYASAKELEELYYSANMVSHRFYQENGGQMAHLVEKSRKISDARSLEYHSPERKRDREIKRLAEAERISGKLRSFSESLAPDSLSPESIVELYHTLRNHRDYVSKLAAFIDKYDPPGSVLGRRAETRVLHDEDVHNAIHSLVFSRVHKS